MVSVTLTTSTCSWFSFVFLFCLSTSSFLYVTTSVSQSFFQGSQSAAGGHCATDLGAWLWPFVVSVVVCKDVWGELVWFHVPLCNPSRRPPIQWHKSSYWGWLATETTSLWSDSEATPRVLILSCSCSTCLPVEACLVWRQRSASQCHTLNTRTKECRWSSGTGGFAHMPRPPIDSKGGFCEMKEAAVRRPGP